MNVHIVARATLRSTSGGVGVGGMSCRTISVREHI
jgi:hypothetical protein